MFHFGFTCFEEIIYKKGFMIPATDVSVAGLPSMGSNILLHAASPSDSARDLSETSIVLSTCVEHLLFQFGLHVWVEYNTQQHRSARVGIIPELHSALSKTVPQRRGVSFVPYAVFSSVLQRYNEDDLLLVVIDTHNITIHTMRLSLKVCCLEINVTNVPTLAGCHLATHPKSRSFGSKRICLLMSLLFVLENSQYPSCLCLEEVTLFVRLNGKHPSSRYVIPRFDLPQNNKTEKLFINRGITFQEFCLSKLFVISSYFFC